MAFSFRSRRANSPSRANNPVPFRSCPVTRSGSPFPSGTRTAAFWIRSERGTSPSRNCSPGYRATAPADRGCLSDSTKSTRSWRRRSRTVAERIRTRRWREKERGEALQRLQAAFADLLRWSARTTRYCQRAERCTDPGEKETVLDAACLGILKVGELINRVERMQHGFWEDFNAAHFLDLRRMRNLIGHTDDLEGEDVIPLGTGIVQALHTAIRRTLFPEKAGPHPGRYKMPTSTVHCLEPTRPGEKPTPENSIAMIRLDEKHRFVIARVGRSVENKMLVSSSVTGSMNVSVYAVRTDPTKEPGTRDRHE